MIIRRLLVGLFCSFFIASCTNDSSTTSGSSVLLAVGDIVECSSGNSQLTADIIKLYPTATVATLGDNVYEVGSKEEFECYDKTWGKFKLRTNPSVGNHEYETANAKGYFDYFSSRVGDSDKGYYTYQLGSWRMIALNSNCEYNGGCGTNSPQYRWLNKILSKSQERCALAYMHNPWRSSGPHGPSESIKPLIELLYEHGADVVLSGHDHIYERFSLQDPHGRADKRRGMRQFVVGTGGRFLHEIDEPLNNSEVRNNEVHGILKLNLNENLYTWEFLGVKEGVVDKGESKCH